MREPEQVDALLAGVLERYERIDVLVNNAGGQFIAPAEDISPNGWRAVQRLNVDAVWYLTRAVATGSMIPAGGGLIVFIGLSPRRALPGMAHASAARAAVENLGRTLAIEWGRHRIRTVTVTPGVIRTEGLDGYGEEQVAEWEREVPIGRLGLPEEVGSLIAFLASAGRRIRERRHDPRRRRHRRDGARPAAVVAERTSPSAALGRPTRLRASTDALPAHNWRPTAPVSAGPDRSGAAPDEQPDRRWRYLP